MLGSATITRSLLATAVIASVLAAPQTASAANRKHHITLAIGYQKMLSDDMKPAVDTGGGPVQLDFTDAGSAALSYRFSLRPNLDLTLDARGVASRDEVQDADVTLSTSYFGPGIRLVGPNEGLRPFVQANFFFVNEELEFEYQNLTVSASESGVGFGVSAGADIRASNLISIPIQAEYVNAKPEDDVSGIGASVGITFNFGELR